MISILCPLGSSLSYHFNVIVAWVEGEQVSSDKVSLLIIPVDVENEALLLNLLHGCTNNCFDSPKV